MTDTAYSVIYADPPWHFAVRSSKGDGRSARQHYQTASLDDLKALPVASWCACDCALFLWAIDPMLPQALDLMAAWGFTFKTVAFTWAKIDKRGVGWHFGLGYWTRANSEMVLLGTRGRPIRGDRDVRQLQTARVREHSRKPDKIRDEIVRLVPAGPRLEMFARSTHPDWSSWGDETGKFDRSATP